MRLVANDLLARGRRTVSWAVGFIGPSGFTAAADEILAHYKAVSAFTLAGQTDAATQIADHIGRRFHKCGDFNANPRDAAGQMGGANYRNAWIVRGMHLLGRYELSGPGADHLEAQLDKESGGCRLLPSAWEAGSDLDFGTTCSAAIALLAAGRMSAAQRCGTFLATQVMQQLQTGQRLVLRVSPTGTMVMPEAGSTAAFVIDAAAPASQQLYWPLGMALVAFARLTRATGDAQWQAPAEMLLRFITQCGPDVATHITNGKIAWGVGEMSQVSPNPAYRTMAESLVRNITAAQEPSGVWVRRPQYAAQAEQPLAVSLDTSLERAAYMFDLAKVFAA